MSTRGSITLVSSKKTITLYNHSDSYPSYLGNKMIAWINSLLASPSSIPAVMDKIDLMTRIDEDANPTDDELKKLAENLAKAGRGSLHENVSTGQDWYSWLRGAQGDLDATLDSGFYVDASDFPGQSLYCEWAYVVDFTGEPVFEVHKGFQSGPHDQGRFAGLILGGAGGYFPVKLVRSWPIHDLPEDLNTLEQELES